MYLTIGASVRTRRSRSLESPDSWYCFHKLRMASDDARRALVCVNNNSHSRDIPDGTDGTDGTCGRYRIWRDGARLAMRPTRCPDALNAAVPADGLKAPGTLPIMGLSPFPEKGSPHGSAPDRHVT